ncbi:NADH-ubiquinone oxidoreductase-F iron-sulfur binding region domain-containing protein [Streptacidiphilus rugosus]|uniref:NADH-ubiquinone oxidoreductase-F iron-sulfur binding region domain-containing protein n=1 Tax=Streptacidiphilus rugosus TaxID=405783 RepID=UPI00069169E3|nr:NADH-ubiquinone oxidoreductase-F iron-sulfur binding region domain-containing protein [Streptacidiphilus rugosus]
MSGPAGTTATTTTLRGDGSGPYRTQLLAGWLVTGGPADLEQHLARYGPAPLAGRVRRGTAAPVVTAVEAAGLTGRGGAGFPTGRKLRAVAERRGRAVVVANAMESEPASAKDKTLLRLAPHLVLDGLALAAEAVGATAAHLCLPRSRSRGGVSEAVRAVRRAVAERAGRGLDPLPVQIHELPHHYVSSEETALVNWLNGGLARPLTTPPRPFEKGVGGRPTLVDNVETLAHIALIARYGPDWFRGTGSPDAPGTLLTTLGGAVAMPGVYEAMGGDTIGELFARAGGVTGPVQAVLVGGYFGTWLPADLAARTPFTRDALAPLGASPGAGVLVALPSTSCGLRETAAVLHFLARSSAQQCGPCQFGLPAVSADFTDLAVGGCDPQEFGRLGERIALLAGRGSCHHPDGASRLAASALRVFAADVEHHLRRRSCPAAGPDRPRILRVPRAPIPADDGWR